MYYTIGRLAQFPSQVIIPPVYAANKKFALKIAQLFFKSICTTTLLYACVRAYAHASLKINMHSYIVLATRAQQYTNSTKNMCVTCDHVCICVYVCAIMKSCIHIYCMCYTQCWTHSLVNVVSASENKLALFPRSISA